MKNGSRLRLLFVCTANIDRSPTGEDIYQDIPGVEIKSAGTEGYATVAVSRSLIEWADLIFCMENHHRVKVREICPEAACKIVVLGIPDHYRRGDPELVELIKEGVSRHLDR